MYNAAELRNVTPRDMTLRQQLEYAMINFQARAPDAPGAPGSPGCKTRNPCQWSCPGESLALVGTALDSESLAAAAAVQVTVTSMRSLIPS